MRATKGSKSTSATLGTKSAHLHDASNISKLDIHLKHITISQLRNYHKTAELRDSQLLPIITSVVSSFCCQIAFPPTPHPFTSTSPPGDVIQCHLSVDVVTIDGECFLNFIDRSTRWSEVLLNRRDLSEKVRIFHRIQVNHHGTPRTILSDREYKKGSFLQ